MGIGSKAPSEAKLSKPETKGSSPTAGAQAAAKSAGTDDMENAFTPPVLTPSNAGEASNAKRYALGQLLFGNFEEPDNGRAPIRSSAV